MLKLITLIVCVIGFVFLGPKALAEFRQVRPRTRRGLTDNGRTKDKDTGDEPKPGVAAEWLQPTSHLKSFSSLPLATSWPVPSAEDRKDFPSASTG